MKKAAIAVLVLAAGMCSGETPETVEAVAAVDPPAPTSAAQAGANRFQKVFSWGRVPDEKTACALAAIGVTDVCPAGTNGYAAARRYGLRTYCSFTPCGPHRQVLRPEEQRHFDFINGADLDKSLSKDARRKILDGRLTAARCQFGGEPVTLPDLCPQLIPCFLSDTGGAQAKAVIEKTLRGNPLADGIVFDYIGYTNLRSCECADCRTRLLAWLASRGLAETEGNRNRFFRDSLVAYINGLADYAKSVRPGLLVGMHLYPVFLPDPLYGRDIRADDIHETVAWYFPWPKEKIADYTRRILTAPHQSGAASVPFVGLKSRKDGALAYKSPERLEEELKLILANGGRSLSVCNGSDMLDPGYDEVFRRYTRPPSAR